MVWEDYIPQDIKRSYEIHDFKHAAAILAKEFPEAFDEICQALRKFRFTVEDVITPGGSESQIPKRFSAILRPLGWKEEQLTAKVIVSDQEVSHDTHKVDYIKGRIALDLEWNSKDQTYDRALDALKGFFRYGRISAAILIVRTLAINRRLLERLSERTVGLPILLIGIAESRFKSENLPQDSSL